MQFQLKRASPWHFAAMADVEIVISDDEEKDCVFNVSHISYITYIDSISSTSSIFIISTDANFQDRPDELPPSVISYLEVGMLFLQLSGGVLSPYTAI